MQSHFSIALLGNRTFYSTSRDQNQPIKRSEFNKVLYKSVYTRCYGCKKFHTAAFHKPPPGNLPVERTEGSSPFQVFGVDYAGPMTYRVSKKKEGKMYISYYLRVV